MTDSPLDHLRFHETEKWHIADAVRAVDRDNAHIGAQAPGCDARLHTF